MVLRGLFLQLLSCPAPFSLPENINKDRLGKGSTTVNFARAVSEPLALVTVSNGVCNKPNESHEPMCVSWLNTSSSSTPKAADK